MATAGKVLGILGTVVLVLVIAWVIYQIAVDTDVNVKSSP
jgi:hypothetical protein